MAPGEIIISLLILAGAVLMGLSVFATLQLLILLQGSRYLKIWRLLAILMIFFLVGYLLALGVSISGSYQILILLTGVIFFFGALFVLAVVRLSQRTISDQMATTVTKAHLENIIGTIPDVVVVAGKDQKIQRVNQAAVQVCGYPEADLVARPVNVILPGLELCQQDCSDQVIHFERNLVTSAGQSIPVLLSVSTLVGTDRQVIDYVILARDITEQKLAEARLQHSASHDPLTGLPNRNLLYELLEHAVELSRRDSQKEFGLLFIDLDNFKEINDHHGHVLGDEALIEVAHRLERCCRHEDLVSRYAGDEFVILLQNSASQQDVEAMAARVLREVEIPFIVAGSRMRLSASIGYLSTRNGSYSSAAAVIRDADQALYAAKMAGRSCYRQFGAGI